MVYLLRRRKLGKTSCKGITLASTKGIQVFRNDVPLPPAEIVFRWGCTSNVEARTIINKAEGIQQVSDKRGFRETLQEAKLCPETWFTRANIQVPCVIRPAYHAQGRNLFYCKTNEEVDAALARVGAGFYASAYIDKAAEYRVFVAQGRAVWMTRKFPGNPADIAWNVARGGRFENIRWEDWPLKAVRVSIEAMNLSKLDFGGVDVMEDRKGNVFVLEINAAPSQTSPYRQQCVAKAFDYMVQKGHARIPLIPDRGDWKKFIHPALSERAKLCQPS